MRYQMLLKILDEQEGECGVVEGDVTRSPQASAKDVLHKFDDLRNDAGRLKRPVDLSDELKGAARRFGV